MNWRILVTHGYHIEHIYFVFQCVGLDIVQIRKMIASRPQFGAVLDPTISCGLLINLRDTNEILA